MNGERVIIWNLTGNLVKDSYTHYEKLLMNLKITPMLGAGTTKDENGVV